MGASGGNRNPRKDFISSASRLARLSIYGATGGALQRRPHCGTGWGGWVEGTISHHHQASSSPVGCCCFPSVAAVIKPVRAGSYPYQDTGVGNEITTSHSVCKQCATCERICSPQLPNRAHFPFTRTPVHGATHDLCKSLFHPSIQHVCVCVRCFRDFGAY